MAAYDPRDDVPDEDRELLDEVPDDALAPDGQIDPLKADEADQLEQAIIVPADDDEDRR